MTAMGRKRRSLALSGKRCFLDDWSIIRNGIYGAARLTEVAPEILTVGISGFSVQQQHDAASKEKTMARRPRGNHSPAFKAKVAVAAIKGEKTLIELAQDFDVLSNRQSNLSASEPDQAVARPVASRCDRGVWGRPEGSLGAGDRCEDSACEDRRADAGEWFFVRRARQAGLLPSAKK